MKGVVAALVLGAATAGSVAVPQPAAAAGPSLGECAPGEVCLWPESRFRGERRAYELEGTPMGSCRRLPGDEGAQSFANRTGRPVTVYESGECKETADFHTHPSGAWTPEGAYRVRAFKIWKR